MKSNSSALSLRQAFISLIILIVGISILFFALSRVNTVRKEQMYTKYAAETNAYINAHQQSLEEVFGRVFANTACYTSGQNNCSEEGRARQIGKLLPSTLKDWSSTYFIKRTAPNKYLAMRLSGQVIDFFVSPQEKADLIEDLLSGRRQEIPWDTYGYELNIPQVIVVVKDTKGQIIGAIARGTIE